MLNYPKENLPSDHQICQAGEYIPDAPPCFTEMEIEEIPISFRLHKMKTLVFCAAAHFYDEIYEHLTLPEDFIGYFHKNKNKLHVAMANRFKY